MTVLDRITPEDAKECRRVLAGARGFLERGVCRLTLARDAVGEECSPNSPRACAWCLLGALCAAVASDDVFDFHESGATRPAWLIEGLCEQGAGTMGLGDWSDSHGQHEILALIDGVDQALRGVAA